MSERILFVDDEEQVLEGLRRLLHDCHADWELVFTSCVDDAIVALQSADVDAVISDIKMPKRDGFDLLRVIRESESWNSIPVVMLTGICDASLKREALDRGATDLLAKPVDAADLMARIRSVLRIKAHEDQIRAHSEILHREVRERTAELELARAELIWRLGRAGEYRDNATGRHVERVGLYSRQLAENLGLDAHFVRSIFLTSPLHDIGKVGVPDSLLRKTGALTSEEWVIMRAHTRIGAKILRDDVFDPQHLAILGFEAHSPRSLMGNPLTELAAQIAESHHERWDGKGYPTGLAGEAIPLAARITAVADVYDALSSWRPYKDPYPESEVLKIMRQGVGTQFEPAVFAAFERSIPEFRAIRAEYRDVAAEPRELGLAS